MKQLKTIYVAALIVSYLIGLGYAIAAGHGRIADFWRLETGFFITSTLIFALLMIVGMKLKSKNEAIVNLSMLLAPLLIVLGVCWTIFAFPCLLKSAVKNYGTNDLATVHAYEVVYRHGKFTESTYNLSGGFNAINVELSYHNRLSTIALTTSDPAFKQVYKAATSNNGEEIPVRYLSKVPAIVLPKASLGLPNSANIKTPIAKPNNTDGPVHTPVGNPPSSGVIKTFNVSPSSP